MAELTVKGHASKEIVCTNTNYSFRFVQDGKTISEATGLMDKEIEKFLASVEKIGIKSNQFTIGNISTGKKYSYNNDDKDIYEAERSINFESNFNPKLSNAIIQIIEEEKLEVEYNETHSANGINNIRTELLKEAMEDSKRKAEMIASCAGKAILGIVKVDANYEDHITKKYGKPVRSCDLLNLVSRRLSDDLQPATSQETEDVEVVWLLES